LFGLIVVELCLVAVASVADDKVSIPNPELLTQPVTSDVGPLIVGSTGSTQPVAIEIETKAGRIREVVARYRDGINTNALLSAVSSCMEVQPTHFSGGTYGWRNEENKTAAWFGVNDDEIYQLTVIISYFGPLDPLPLSESHDGEGG
jgi:hypothetical protein